MLNHAKRNVVHLGLATCLLGLVSLWVCGCKSAVPTEESGPAAVTRAKATGNAEKGAELTTKAQPQMLLVFCGSAGKPGIDDVAAAFEKDHPGVTVARSYGGSGTVLSQMIVGETGDVYIPGSDDFMDKAEKKAMVLPGTRKIVCYLVPVIAVQKGNPKGIKTLDDFAKPGVKVGIGAPKTVCLGDIAMEVFQKAKVTEKVTPNIVTHADSCGTVETLLKLKHVDAAIGWDVFAASSPKDIDIIQLPAGLTKMRSIPAAVAKYTKNRALAEEFVKFIAESDVSHQAFKKHGFTVK